MCAYVSDICKYTGILVYLASKHIGSPFYKNTNVRWDVLCMCCSIMEKGEGKRID